MHAKYACHVRAADGADSLLAEPSAARGGAEGVSSPAYFFFPFFPFAPLLLVLLPL